MTARNVEETLRTVLRSCPDTPSAVARALHIVAEEESSAFTKNALMQVIGVLTNPSPKPVSQLVDDYFDSLRTIDGNASLESEWVWERVFLPLDALSQIVSVLRGLGRQVRIPVPGVSRSERPLLVNYVEEYVSLVRAQYQTQRDSTS